MKRFINEFKEFALKGNVLALAVGIIIGGALAGVVTSLTDNLLSPLLGLFTGRNFDALVLRAFGATFRYGAFLTSLLNFIIMAFVVFLIVRGINRLWPEKPPVPPRLCPFCKSELHAEATRCPHCTSLLEGA